MAKKGKKSTKKKAKRPSRREAPVPPPTWRKAWMLPAIAPLVIGGLLALAHLVTGELANPEWALSFADEPHSALDDAERRMIWAVSWAALVGVGLTSIGLALKLGVDLARRSPGWGPGRAVTITITATAVVLVCVLANLAKAYFGVGVTDAIIPEPVHGKIRVLTGISNTTTATATILIAAAVCAICRDQLLEDRSPEELESARRRTKLLLYAGAAVLMVGALEVSHLCAWPEAWVSNDAIREKVLQFARTSSSTIGLMGTMLLIAIFLPAWLLLGKPTRAVEDAPAEKAVRREQSRVERLLEGSKLLVAILAPILGSWVEDWVMF